MPCNPSIGGTAKGHLVREIDALGGEMGKAADATFLQSRILNRGKGPAVHSLRVQSDRVKYHAYMKSAVEHTENLYLKQDEITDILTDGGKICGVRSKLGSNYAAKAVIIAGGTYLKGKVFVGGVSYESGPDSTLPANLLSNSLTKLGVELRRFKTGTPCRVHRRSIDFSKLEKQDGDEEITPFSFENHEKLENKISCYIGYTNAETHKVILENIHRSAMYSGKIEGVGPRYCPSIEDKVKRFSDKPRHQLFIEPMGLDTEECYVQGMSSSLPEEVQLKFMRTIKGLEHVEIMRNAYAIEYDCCDPTQLFAYAGVQEHREPLRRGAVQRYFGLRRSSGAGACCGNKRGAENKGRAADGARPRFVLHRHAYRRPCDERLPRPVQNVDIAQRVQAASAAGQRRPAAYGNGPQGRTDLRRAVCTFAGEKAAHRAGN